MPQQEAQSDTGEGFGAIALRTSDDLYLGVNSLAVSSTGCFWQGDDYENWCLKFAKRRGDL